MFHSDEEPQIRSIVRQIPSVSVCVPVLGFATVSEAPTHRSRALFGPILSAKLVESRTPKQTTVFADSLPARATHRFLRNRTRPEDSDRNGLQPARFNQPISRTQFAWGHDEASKADFQVVEYSGHHWYIP